MKLNLIEGLDKWSQADIQNIMKLNLTETLDEWLKSDANENETHYVIEPDLECRT
jgi:hypothetical protein